MFGIEAWAQHSGRRLRSVETECEATLDRLHKRFEERLASLGITILHWALVSDTVGLMRLGIAEARRFPNLASSVHRTVRERGTGAVARLLREVAQSDELGRAPAFAPRRLATTTRFFLDLVLLPLLLRALFGEKLKLLHTEVGPHVARSVAFFLAACRHGGSSHEVGAG